MMLLLDTHVFVWWVAYTDVDLIPERTRDLIGDPDNQIFVSSASVYEIVYKHSSGKWNAIADLALDVIGKIDQSGFRILPISGEEMARAARLSLAHRDPFDRIIAAQTIAHNLVLATRDGLIARHFGVAVVWD